MHNCRQDVQLAEIRVYEAKKIVINKELESYPHKILFGASL